MMDSYSRVSSGLTKLQHDIINDLISVSYVTGLILGIVGFVILLIEIGTMIKIRSIERWPVKKGGAIIYDSITETKTDANTFSLLVVSTSATTTSYRTRASFIYRVDDLFYLSTKLSYIEPWSNNPVISKSENDLIKPGTVVDVRINPNNPKEAFVYNHSYHPHWKLLIGAAFTLLGVYLIYKV